MADDMHPEDAGLNLPDKEVRTGWLTETEIKDCWRTNMLSAADDAAQLAKLPERGVSGSEGAYFLALRGHLALAEGACRQMCHWREDSRWLYLAPQLEQLHQMARVMLVSRYAKQLFTTLQQTLRKLVADADALETKATGRVGMILPPPLPLIRTEGRPVQVIVGTG